MNRQFFVCFEAERAKKATGRDTNTAEGETNVAERETNVAGRNKNTAKVGDEKRV